MKKDPGNKRSAVVKKGHDINIVVPLDKKEGSKRENTGKDEVSDLDIDESTGMGKGTRSPKNEF